MSSTPLIQTPNDCIAKAIARRGLPQRRLARSLLVDASRFNRWVHGDEQIPRGYLLELAQHLPPADVDYLLRLKDCEDMADQLQRRLQDLSGSLGLGDCLQEIILADVHNLVAAANPRTSLAQADALLRHLVDAAGAALIVKRVADVSFQEPLLLPTTVPRFRYPINHFIGRILDLDQSISARAPEARAVVDLRERLLKGLRTVAASKPSRQRWPELARQFSIHVLARHGDASDRERVQEMALSTSATVDPLLRRISYTGVVLGGSNADTREQFLRSLQRDSGVATTNLFFNAFHYGDVAFAPDGTLPRLPKSFSHALPHIFRHLEHPDRYAGILDIEAFTLLQLLETAGPRTFLHRPTLRQLQQLLSSDSRLLQRLKPSVRAPFQRQFSRLINDAIRSR